MTKNDPRLRITLYIVVSAAGLALVAWGIVTQDFVDGILPVVGGLLGVVGGGVAVKNVPTTREQTPGVSEWISIGRDALPAVLDEIRRLREDVQGQLAPPAQAPSAFEYVPDRAPWLPDEHVGQHRAGE